MTEPGPPLSRAAFDRAAHRRVDEAWLADVWPHARVIAVSSASSTPTTRGSDGRAHARIFDALDVAGDAVRRFLGLVNGTPYFAVTLPSGDDWATLRDIGRYADDLEAGLLTAAVALEQWHLRHTHCPLCGAPTVESKAGWTRTCTADASEHFPRTDPAVIMLVTDGADRALLGRGHQWAPGRFSTLAGFVEPGESLEAAVAREVVEEVGVEVTDIHYVASQPWPFPASLMLGFTARLGGDDSLTPDLVELAEAAWFTRDDVRQAADWTDEDISAPEGDIRLRAIPPHLSISRYLIDGWLAARD